MANVTRADVMQYIPLNARHLHSETLKVTKVTAAEVSCEGWVSLYYDVLHLINIHSPGLCKEIQLLHRSDVLQQGFVWVLSTLGQLVLQPTMVVDGKKFLIESRPEHLHRKHVLADKSKPNMQPDQPRPPGECARVSHDR